MTTTTQYAGELWTPREPPDTEEPGQLRSLSRYTERFAAYEAEVEKPFKGITADGNVIPGLFPIRQTGISTQPIVDAATAFLACLTPQQRALASFPIDTPEWRKWHGLFTTLFRHGLKLEDLAAGQLTQALALLQSCLSPHAFAMTEDIRRTNDLIRQITGRWVDFGAGVYWISIMGTPSLTEPWGWQIDGHHINISFFFLGDQMVMTPGFIGAEPTSVRTGLYAGIRLFADEEADAVTLMECLTPAQRDQAIIGDTLRIDLFTGFFRDNFEMAYQGTPASQFSSDQVLRLRKLIADYVGYMRPGHSDLWQADTDRFLEQTYFGWIGGYEGDAPFYYRVHNPFILIEFSHIPGIALTGNEPSRNHVHAIVRTPNGNDYGKDLLRQHLEREHMPNA